MSKERPRIPLRLDGDEFCRYEDDGEFVRIGDTVKVFVDTAFREFEVTGELAGAEYGINGELVSVDIQDEESSDCATCFNDGEFYRPKERGACALPGA